LRSRATLLDGYTHLLPPAILQVKTGAGVFGCEETRREHFGGIKNYPRCCRCGGLCCSC